MNTITSLNWQKEKISKSFQHQIEAFEKINNLVFIKREGKKIILANGFSLVEFISCSYLGLDLDKRIIDASIKNINDCGVTFPSARTRMIAKSFLLLEQLLNQMFCNNYTVLFQSLHLAHLGLIPLLASGEMPSYPIKSNGILFLLDQHVHASIQINRGLMQQFGQVEIYNLENFDHLKYQLEYSYHHSLTPIIFSDSIGSMGGIAPLKLLFELVEQYDGYLYLDDAHGTSVFGQYGCGYVLEQLNYNFHPRLILTSSLAKAFGSNGGIVVMPTQKDSDFIKQFSSTYIFGGPPALSTVDAAIASANIHLSEEITSLQAKLQYNLSYFDSLCNSSKILNYQNPSPIRAAKVGDEFRAIEIAAILHKKGFALTTAMYPTVAKGKSLLRIALGALHTEEQIYLLCKTLEELI